MYIMRILFRTNELADCTDNRLSVLLATDQLVKKSYCHFYWETFLTTLFSINCCVFYYIK